MSTPAVFLDRDGVLVADTGLITDGTSATIIPGVCAALMALHEAGVLLVLVSNQTVLARGMLDERGVERIQRDIENRLFSMGAPSLDGFYYCGHHPNATLDKWRTRCLCRKPEPGLIINAAHDLDVDISKSYMIGDRLSDTTAGARAGCKTILVKSGRHADPPIQTWTPFEPSKPDIICQDLKDASRCILQEASW